MTEYSYGTLVRISNLNIFHITDEIRYKNEFGGISSLHVEGSANVYLAFLLITFEYQKLIIHSSKAQNK
jgi:hypothetical protein